VAHLGVNRCYLTLLDLFTSHVKMLIKRPVIVNLPVGLCPRLFMTTLSSGKVRTPSSSLSQFHQHFMSSFWAYILSSKNQSQTVIREKLRKALSHKKVSSKMLIKLTPCRRAWRPPWTRPPARPSVAIQSEMIKAMRSTKAQFTRDTVLR